MLTKFYLYKKHYYDLHWLKCLAKVYWEKNTLMTFVLMNWINFLHDQNAACTQVELQTPQFQYTHLNEQVSSFF